jgi:hypothetical protein
VELGIRSIGVRTQSELDKWTLLLYSLVSRQGGGIVVSLAEPADVLCKRAAELHIDGDVNPGLAQLTKGLNPLLRGEPVDQPRLFSLKHDMLAVFLSRWFDEHGGAVRARQEERRKWQLIAALGLAAALIVMAFATFIIVDRSARLAETEDKAIKFRNEYAANPRTGDFRLSLLLLLYDLDRSAKARNLYEKIFHTNVRNHDATIQVLRGVLPRVPWLNGRYEAVGIDPTGSSLALLEGHILKVLHLPREGEQRVTPAEPERYDLGERAETSWPPPSVGFVDGLGPVAFVDGKLHFWVQGEHNVRDLWKTLREWIPEDFESWSPSVEFRAGRLLVTKFIASDMKSIAPGKPPRNKLVFQNKYLWLDSGNLGPDPIKLPPQKPTPLSVERVMGQPQIVTSTISSLPLRYQSSENWRNCPQQKSM